MPRPKGIPKTGGRQKGTKDKNRQAVIDQLAALNCDPIQGLARIAVRAEEEGNDIIATKCYAELSSYCYAKLRAVEVKQDNAEPITFHLTTSKSLQILDEAMADAGITREPIKEVKPAKAEPPESLLTKVKDGHQAKTEFIPAPAVEAAPAAAWTPLDYGPSTVV